jgi:hypothetical protein
MSEKPEPNLAPPGAGLPKLELLAARALFGWNQMRSTRESANNRFQQERGAVRALIARCDAKSGAERVLIARVRGMEDSSRNWSVWMTLDHLRIIHNAVSRTIGALAEGSVPPGKAIPPQ